MTLKNYNLMTVICISTNLILIIQYTIEWKLIEKHTAEIQHKQNIVTQLSLRHIPDAVPNELTQDKNILVIELIRKTLISKSNFKQFQTIKDLYSNDNLKPNIFFFKFKNLFEPLCDEKIWIDILMKMLALLRDNVKK
eukprot:18926_1